jgi:hypothetical protein
MSRQGNRRLWGWLSAGALATLAGCGGGGGGSDGDGGTAAPSSVVVSGVAADGPLQGATACYDLNENGRCDSGEPASSPTDANGAFRIDVATAEAGKHRVVVEVPASAIDKDTGQAVGQAFTLQAPATGNGAAHSVFASPLSTLVQLQMDYTGASRDDAAAWVQAQAGLAISPLADYTADTSAAGRSAAITGRLVALAQLREMANLAPDVVGKTDLTGATIDAAALEKAVRQNLLPQLPALAAAATDPSIANAADEAARRAAIASVAQSVADAIAPSADQVRQSIGVAKLPPETAQDTASPAVSLRQLQYTDADHWFYRALLSSAADNTPDAKHHQRYYDVRSQATTDVFGLRHVDSWASGSSFERRADLHWNGSAWVSCDLGQRSWNTGRDAQGRTEYDYCDGYAHGMSTRSAMDIAGQTLRSVIETKVRTFVGSDSGRPYSGFGPADLSLLGSATFPAGSKLYIYSDVPTATASAYDVQPTNITTANTAAVAAGGDARTGSPACAQVTNANAASFLSQVTSLEDLAARNPGVPCVFAQGSDANGTSLDPDEWWSNGTASLGTAANAATPPAGTGSYYTTTAAFRVGFDAGSNGTRYYSCLVRKLNGSIRNCTLIGRGSYTVQTLGDARVMSFNGLPAATQKVGFTRVFVERGGKVYWGYRNPLAPRGIVGFNLEAANAIFQQLGLQPLVPIPPASAADTAKASLFANAKGVWAMSDANSALVLRFGDGGRMLLAQTAGDATQGDQPGVELGFLDIDPVSGVYRALLNTDTNWQGGVSHPNGNLITSITATQLVATDVTLARLQDDPNGLVGYWALGSATDLNTQQFVFFANGRVLMIDPVGETAPSDAGSACFNAHQGPAGIEWARYTFNAATGLLHVFGKEIDTNGCAGLFDSSQGALQNGTANTVFDAVVTFSSDRKQLTTSDGATLFRIAPQ